MINSTSTNKKLHTVFPIVAWLPGYKWANLKNDLIAGITVGTLLIPQGMAYALLAGLPPISGLYAALVPLLIYPIFGTSKHLSVGPVAMDSLLVAAGVGVFANQGTDNYLSLAILLAVMVGLIQLIMGVTRLGFLVNFLSRPLINGFTSAAAIIIALSQIKHMFRIEIEGSQKVHLVISRIFEQIEKIHIPTLILGVSCVLLLVFLKKFKPKWPGAFITIALGIISVRIFDLHSLGVQIVGDIPIGLPYFRIPDWNPGILLDMLPIAFTIALISFMEGIAIAKQFADKEGYTIRANQELVAIGMSNATSGLFGGYPIAGSFSRTAVTKQTGGQTGLASVFNAMTIALTLLVLTPLFYFMPNVALAAVVIVTVAGLIDLKEPRRLARIRKRDVSILMFSFVVTLLFGAWQGILLGALASIILIIHRISYPPIALLGQMPGTTAFRNVKREVTATEVEGVILFRIDASLYYANSSYLKDRIQENIVKKGNVRAFAIDATSINEVDATASATLAEIADELSARGIEFYFTDVKWQVRDSFQKSGLYEKLGADHFFLEKMDFIKFIRNK